MHTKRRPQSRLYADLMKCILMHDTEKSKVVVNSDDDSLLQRPILLPHWKMEITFTFSSASKPWNTSTVARYHFTIAYIFPLCTTLFSVGATSESTCEFRVRRPHFPHALNCVCVQGS